MNDTTWIRVARPLGALALAIAAVAGPASQANAQATRKAAPPEPKGLAIIFDASESTCGYFLPEDKERKLLGLIKKSATQRDPDANNRIYLLKQQGKNSLDPQRDIVEAPANLQAQAEVLADKPKKQGSACAPFNGAGSNLELIFDPRSALTRSQSMVLVTDGQFLEKDREKFVQGFIDWATGTQAKGLVPYAGVALVQAQFAGRYFSVTEPNARLRESGYDLPQHKRPLLAFWFARGDGQLPRIKELIAAVSPMSASSDPTGFVQHILPLPALGPAWMDTQFSTGVPLPSLVGSLPTFTIKQFDTSRSTRVISECLRPSVTAQGVVVESLAKCSDGKPIFDGVSEILVRFRLVALPFYDVRYKGDTGAGAPSIAWRLTSQAFGDSPFQLEAVAKSAGSRAAYAPFGMDSDHCSAAQLQGMIETRPPDPAKPAPGPDCVEKLDGKAYQLDVLLDQMLNRRQAVSQSLLGEFGAKTYTFSFRSRK